MIVKMPPRVLPVMPIASDISAQIKAPPSPWPRRACWLTLALLHTAACAFFSLFTVVYTQLSDVAFGSNTFVYSLVLPLRDLRMIGVVCGVLGALHLVLLGRMLVSSIYTRRLCFKMPSSRARHPPMLPGGGSSRREITQQTTTTGIASSVRRRLSVARDFASGPIIKVVGRHGWIGVDGPYFDHFFVVRELGQVILQTIQLHKIAQYISTPWLLNVSVAIVCANCWSSQILHLVNGRLELKPKRRRLYALVIDSCLDAVSAFLVPFVVVVPYAAAYNTASRSFLTLWGDDLWVMQATADIRLLLLPNWGDAAAQFLFSLVILVSSNACHDFCHKEFDVHEPERMPSKRTKVDKTSRPRLQHIRYLIHGVLIVWGLSVAGLHLYASIRPHVEGCLLPVRPWFSSHTACAVIDFNCHARLSTGNFLETSTALEELAPQAVVYVIFQHCRGLEIPTSIQGFSNLIGIKLYNTTLVEWSSNAAVRGDTNPSFRQITAVRVAFPNNGHGLPDGLVHPNFPATVADVNVCVSNLKSLPSDLDQKWPKGLSLLLEYCKFDEFPDVATRMDISVLSLNGNRIRSVPVDKMFLPTRRLRILSLGAGNPIEDFGFNVSRIELPPAFYWLILDSTNLTTLPLWMRTDPAVMTRMWLIMSDSPVCKEVLRFLGAPPDALGGFHWQQFVDCRDYSFLERTLYRLTAEDRRRSLDPSRIGSRDL